MRHISPIRLVAALLATVWAPSAFAAEDMNQCVAAYEGAQTSQKEGKYVQALDQAKFCAQSGCGILVNECLKMYDDLQRDVPSFVFSAQNGDGQELVNVNVIVDGKPTFTKIDGSALSLDPGAHTFRFESEGLPPVEVSHVARLGDRHRLISVTLGEKSAPLAPAAAAPAPSEPLAPEEPEGIPAATWGLGGLGVLSLGAFAYLRITGVSDYNELNSSCSPRCDPSEVDDIKTKFTASWGALGVAGAAFAGAAVFYFTSRPDSKEESFQATVMPLPGGGGAHLMKRF